MWGRDGKTFGRESTQRAQKVTIKGNESIVLSSLLSAIFASFLGQVLGIIHPTLPLILAGVGFDIFDSTNPPNTVLVSDFVDMTKGEGSDEYVDLNRRPGFVKTSTKQLADSQRF